MACIKAPTAPIKIPANNPAHGPCFDPINPPPQAPIIIMPSRPIFTTPERSEKRPPSAAIAIGTESNSAADAVPALVKSDAPVIVLITDKPKTKLNA